MIILVLLFYFQQALMKHIRQEGLAKAYQEDIGTRDILRQIMALCYIPERYIERQFTKLKSKCSTAAMLRFAIYFEETWLKLWSPSDWCVFLCSIRTNNTLEGLNFKLNSTCKHDIPFYELVHKLHSESINVCFDIKCWRYNCNTFIQLLLSLVMIYQF